MAAQVAVVERREVHAVEEDRALGGLEEARDELDERRLAAAAAADERDGLARRDLERDRPRGWRASPGRRSGSPRRAARCGPRGSAPGRSRDRSVALLRLLLEDVVQTGRGAPTTVSNRSHIASSRRMAACAISASVLKATNPPTRQSSPCTTRSAPTQRKSAIETIAIVWTALSYDRRNSVPAKRLLRDGQELREHRVAERRLGRGRLHRLDPLDGVDLVRAVPPSALLEVDQDRPQVPDREEHEQRVERRSVARNDPGQRARCRRTSGPAVPSSCTAASSPPIPCWTTNSRTSWAPSSRRWMSPVRRLWKYRIGSASSRRVRKSRIDASIRTAAKASRYCWQKLASTRKHDRDAHRQHDHGQQADLAVDDDRVDDGLREDGEQELERADHAGEQEHLAEDRPVAREERDQPREARPSLGGPVERVGVVEERGVAGPPLLERAPARACAVRAPGRPRARGPSRRRRRRPSGCPPSGRSPAAARRRGCARTPSPRAPRGRARSPRGRGPSGSCRRWPCGRARGCGRG